jgi:hypothetical protein
MLSRTSYNICNHSEFALGSKKATEELDRLDQSQNIPGTTSFMFSGPSAYCITVYHCHLHLLYRAQPFDFFKEIITVYFENHTAA